MWLDSRRVSMSRCKPLYVSSRPKTHQAAVCKELGKPLQITHVPSVVNLGEGQVRIAVHSCGINFSDVLLAAGLYQEKPPLPFIPGSEVSGEVLEVGNGVSKFSKGDRVLGLLNLQGFSQECVADQMSLWKMPDSMSFEMAAALPISYGTAWLALTRRSNTKPGETVLVTAAAGAVGLATIDLATNVIGAKAVGAAGGPEKCSLVTKRGALCSVDYKIENIREKVKEATGGKGVDVVFESVGGDVFKESLRCLSWGGRLVVIGFAGGDIPKVPANILLVKNISAVGLYWGSYRLKDFQTWKSSIEDVMRFFEAGKIEPHVCKTFRLEEVNEAFRYIQQRKSTGKVVLNMQ
ncbi:quinone oxidoreductase-like protein 2 homolog isoform X2 [Anneissia japonica]|uniref:quinone oxidoreductase-like protein 2 homolog isoform X2 n=1 Tax=Anneissia japonica TaxID=1529436 RepID=UPI0014257035|nr:quinone oxidoreductase-like protein 2 homolog isoform X2 [Anneissia japonica]